MARDGIEAFVDALAERARSLREEIAAAGRGDLALALATERAVRLGDATPARAAHAAAQLFAYGLLCARWFELRGQGGKGLSLLCERLGGNRLASLLFERADAAARHCASARAIEALVADSDLDPVLGSGAEPLARSYECFLGAYDARLRRARGVYFTPAPLAAFVVRRVHALLRDEVGLDLGLGAWADRTARPVHVLDPAVGTGAFLAEVVRLVRDALAQHHRRQGLSAAQEEAAWRVYARERLLPRLHGIEWMPASYAVCHAHLAITLADTGYRLASEDAIGVCLADALRDGGATPDGTRREALADACADDEARAAELSGAGDVAVILMNPPYRRGARSRGDDSARGDALAAYREGLAGERNLQPLSDDYVRFVRRAEEQMARRPWGMVGMVGSSTFLSGRLYRGMRRSLGETFGRVDVVDLHGSARVRQQAPGARRDENVFDVGQGVAVVILRRLGARAGNAPRVHHAELWGSRADKQRALAADDLPPPIAFRPGPPHHLWSPREDVPPEYAGFVSLDLLFSFHSVGGKPGDDAVLVGFDAGEVLRKVAEARAAPGASLTEAARKLARRPADRPFDAGRVVPYAYRPFDTRFVYDEPEIWTRPVPALRRRIDGQPLLLTSRVVKEGAFAHVFAARTLPDVILLSSTSSVNCHVFPASSLRVDIAERALGRTLTARALFAYVYAVLHSPTYRARYAPALALDHPRVPLARDPAVFVALAALGEDLLALHLMDSPLGPRDLPRFVDGGDRRVARGGARGIRLDHSGPEGGRLYVNAASYLEPVPVASWEHRIGGYQVLRKWLLDRGRAGRVLEDADVEHYRRVVAIVGRSLKLASRIDAEIAAHGGWPGAFLDHDAHAERPVRESSSLTNAG